MSLAGFRPDPIPLAQKGRKGISFLRYGGGWGAWTEERPRAARGAPRPALRPPRALPNIDAPHWNRLHIPPVAILAAAAVCGIIGITSLAHVLLIEVPSRHERVSEAAAEAFPDGDAECRAEVERLIHGMANALYDRGLSLYSWDEAVADSARIVAEAQTAPRLCA